MSMKKRDLSKHRFAYKEQNSYEMYQQEKHAQIRMVNWAGKGTITFGKYKGTKIKLLNTGYLEWLIKNVKHNEDPNIKSQLSQAQTEYTQRIKNKINYIKSRHKVGRPVCNTAEEKV